MGRYRRILRARWVFPAVVVVGVLIATALVLSTRSAAMQAEQAITAESEQADVITEISVMRGAAATLRAAGQEFAGSPADAESPPVSWQYAVSGFTTTAQSLREMPGVETAQDEQWQQMVVATTAAINDLDAALTAAGQDTDARQQAGAQFVQAVTEVAVDRAGELGGEAMDRFQADRRAAAAQAAAASTRSLAAALTLLATLALAGGVAFLQNRRAEESPSDATAVAEPEPAVAAPALQVVPAEPPAAPPAKSVVGAYASLMGLVISDDDEMAAHLYLAGRVCDAKLGRQLDALARGEDPDARTIADLRERGLSVEDVIDAAPWVRTRRERWDGTGSPDGLRAESIPMSGRILHVASVLAAAVARDGSEALDRTVDGLEQLAGSRVDPRLAELAASLNELGLLTDVATWCEQTDGLPESDLEAARQLRGLCYPTDAAAA